MTEAVQWLVAVIAGYACAACVVDGSLGSEAIRRDGGSPPASSSVNEGTTPGTPDAAVPQPSSAGGGGTGGVAHSSEGGTVSAGGAAAGTSSTNAHAGAGGTTPAAAGAGGVGGSHSAGGVDAAGGHTAGASGSTSVGGTAGATHTAAECVLTVDDHDCVHCQKGACCDEVAACAPIDGCHCIASCLNDGATQEACEGHCAQVDDGAARALHECSALECPAQCRPQ